MSRMSSKDGDHRVTVVSSTVGSRELSSKGYFHGSALWQGSCLGRCPAKINCDTCRKKLSQKRVPEDLRDDIDRYLIFR
ncbi:MAG: hypothetical protein UV89_C0021G0007 [candidate division WWE3 bacterium GW2011_GWB2_43_22]|uniref:Uncharacterized protein n=1 Tax=candidate division WWE3 bacterium GW2011_GWB2_43_22 TaxID=1619118 RepID=A0A0G1EKM2_UNCKA|nr:MAG: hypothetical protein UV89_C0021G0007 [candidate division WWE3 bacterium GW2011_GWB2_43_22]